jgi:hypothetical protein
MWRRMLLTLALVAGCAWCLTLVIDERPADPPTPTQGLLAAGDNAGAAPT